MTLSRRIGRMEAAVVPIALIEIEAADDIEAEDRFIDPLLPGPAGIAMTIGSIRTEWLGSLRPHEDALALMERVSQ